MKKIVIISIAIVVLIVLYWLASPLFLDKRVSEALPQNIVATTTPQETLSGSFTGFDSIHYGSGDVRIIATTEGYVVRFEDNFNVANGPDLYVGFGKDGVYKTEGQIARLKGNIGSQNYEVPRSINLDDYDEIWIWCRAFSVGFARAKFR